MSDGGELSLDWFPLNYNNFPKETPIIAFLVGSFGTSEDAYSKELCLMIQKKNWRMVILNRRGWDLQPLKNEKFIHQDELQDFYEALLELKKIYDSRIFLIGVSAGSSHGSRLIAKYGRKLPIDAFVSISNPFNVAKLTFQQQYSYMGAYVSKFLCNGYRKIYEYHLNNPHFQNLISKNKVESLDKVLRECDQIIDIDDQITRKIRGFDHVLDYYHEFSCDHVLQDIQTPSLFINNLEDPVCYKENIPINLLYKNPNIITLISERGGHVEYLSGREETWWAFETALNYFEFFLEEQES